MRSRVRVPAPRPLKFFFIGARVRFCESPDKKIHMQISSTGIIDGIIQARFGKFCEETDKLNNVPIRSIPIAWGDLPIEQKQLL